jgi:fumarate hydratase subunit alpha
MDDNEIISGLVRLIQKAETELPLDVIYALRKAYECEDGIAKIQLENILKNIKIAKETQRPLCQDTGVQTFFIEVGKDFPYIGKIKDLILTAVRKASTKIPLRPNTIDPFTHRNHKDNVGNNIPSITWDFIDGDMVVITAIPKGGGSENMSKLVMLKPGEGIEGVKEFIIREIRNAGGNPCPPTVIGIGIGGGADLAMKLGKKALLRPVGIRHPDNLVAEVEKSLLLEINKTGIGPMGLGGNVTALDVHIEKAPRHPASLPVGMVVQCWADRRASMVIYKDGSFELAD